MAFFSEFNTITDETIDIARKEVAALNVPQAKLALNQDKIRAVIENQPSFNRKNLQILPNWEKPSQQRNSSFETISS